MLLLSCIPFRALYILSDLLYYLLYYIVRYRRHIARRNLTESFPEKSLEEIRHIEKSFYQHLSDIILESVKMCSMSESEFQKRMKFVNVEAINAAFRERKSVSLFLGHYGNWEWVSSIPLWLEKGVMPIQIYHKLRNEDIDRLITHNRERMGAISVEMRKTARYVSEMAIKHELSLVGYIADQSPKYRESTHFLTFLHHNTPVLVGSEKLTKHFGYEAWFLKMKRVKRGHYEAEFVQMCKDPKTVPDFELTAQYFHLLEHMIEQDPGSYLWTHNRFKHDKGINA